MPPSIPDPRYRALRHPRYGWLVLPPGLAFREADGRIEVRGGELSGLDIELPSGERVVAPLPLPLEAGAYLEDPAPDAAPAPTGGQYSGVLRLQAQPLPFRPGEVSTTYVRPAERWVVSLVVSLDEVWDEEGGSLRPAETAEEAARDVVRAVALDEQLQWFVWDREREEGRPIRGSDVLVDDPLA